MTRLGDWKPTTRDALIDPSTVGVFTDRGIAWVVSRYAGIRADALARPPATSSPAFVGMKVSSLRRVLEPARRGFLDVPPPRLCGYHNQGPAPQPRVIAFGDTAILHNAKAWDAWTRTGCTPHLHAHSYVSWWCKVRGRDVLVGVTRPMRWADGTYTGEQAAS